MEPENNNTQLGIILMVYLLVVGLGAAVMLVVNFPDLDANGKIKFPYTYAGDAKTSAGVQSDPDIELIPLLRLQSTAQGLLAVAFLAGVAGSFIHAAQSLGSYLGNASFKSSWAVWYLLRPWIGGTLAVAMYLAVRGGLVSGTSTMSPYGIAAIGLLGGWFSKTTADKLQEVFATLFKSDLDKERKDKLVGEKSPVIESVDPSPVPQGCNDIAVLGREFQNGAVVLLDGKEEETKYISPERLEVHAGKQTKRPAVGTKAKIRVRNPQGVEPLSKEHQIEFL